MSAKLRIVLDTNIFVSGLIRSEGPPGRILKALRAGEFILVTSRSINEEVLEVMERPRLRDKYDLSDHLFDVAFLLWERAEVIADLPHAKASPDPDDDKSLAAAAAGAAHYLVTGDAADLLSLGEYHGVGIIAPARFLEILKND